MARAFLVVLDSLGVGGAPDAAHYGDDGSDTLGHIARACAGGHADRAGTRQGALAIPNLVAIGLAEASRTATGQVPRGVQARTAPRGAGGCAAEVSTGKDSQSGHWELAGSPVQFEWGYFPRERPCFPRALIEELCDRADLPGVLGECHASGTEIIEELGAEHLRTGKPIVYTSADSVFQVAAHEESFGLERLYEVCRIARELVDEYRIGRVIARPFVGREAGAFTRTAHRKDYGVAPPTNTLLQRATDARRPVVSLGKIGDLFCHCATGRELKGDDNDAIFDHLLDSTSRLPQGGLLIANFVDFDTLFGHRRDPCGYAHALERFDARLPAFEQLLRPGDLAIITGDHGCDPTWRGSDHTRECVPVLAFGPAMSAFSSRWRESFADVGATLAQHLGLPAPGSGHSFLARSRHVCAGES
jgi:phosphopentomutase